MQKFAAEAQGMRANDLRHGFLIEIVVGNAELRNVGLNSECRNRAAKADVWQSRC
jgi:hypothetical protein